MQSFARGLAVIRSFSARAPQQTLSEVAQRTGLTRAGARRILLTLEGLEPGINAGPGVSTRPDQVVISAQNRNFPGRSGPGQMYLASPLTVAASAVAGYIVEYEPARATAGSVDELSLRMKPIE